MIALLPPGPTTTIENDIFLEVLQGNTVSKYVLSNSNNYDIVYYTLKVSAIRPVYNIPYLAVKELYILSTTNSL